MLRSTFKELDAEKDLLIAISDGDVKSFEKLFNHYALPLGHYANRILEDKILAEDIVQDVFLTIWLNKHKLLEVKSFKDYLFIISKNRVLNSLKSRSSQVVHVSIDLMGEREYADEDNMIEEKVQKEFVFDLLEKEIEQLPPKQRAILKLAKFENKTYQQIAEILHISVETVRKHLFLANKSLRRSIQDKNTEILILIFFSKFL